MYLNKYNFLILNNTIQEISWILLYRDIFLISYRHLKFSISPSTNIEYNFKKFTRNYINLLNDKILYILSWL